MNMAIHNKIVLFITTVVLLSMTAIASYALYKIRILALPISEYLALFAIILPAIAGTAMLRLRKLLNESWRDNYRPLNLSVLALVSLQFIYETIVITLSLTYIFPSSALNCGLSDRWQTLFKSNNEKAIQAIQDNLNCCGLRSVRDRAWPIARNSPSPCSEIFGRSQSCLVPWRKSQQFVGALILVNALFVLSTRIFAAVFIIKKSVYSKRKFLAIEDGQDRADADDGFGRLLVKDNNPSKVFRDIPEPIESANGGPVDWNSDQNLITESTEPIESRNHWDSERSNH